MSSRVEDVRVGYVLKMFPRISETFILGEILTHQAAGLDLQVISLREPDGLPPHGAMRAFRGTVAYMPTEMDLGTVMRSIDEGEARFSGLPGALDGEPVRGLDFLDVYQAIAVAGAAMDRRITHLHAHFGSLAATVARLASRISGIPYSFTAHAKDIFHQAVDRDDLRRKLEEAAFVVTISDYNLAYLQGEYGDSAGGVRRIYNGLDLEQFRYCAPIAREARIVGVGRLIEKKGFADLVDACAILARQGHDFSCEIIGPGPLEADLRAQMDRLELSRRVRLLGPLPQERVIERIQGAAVLAAPCIVGSDGNADGLPTVLLEAMALGTPCVSTDVTGIPEALHDGETGLMAPQNNPDKLAAAIGRLLDDADLRVRLAGAARQLVENEFDIRRNAGLMRELFTAGRRTPVLAEKRRA